MTESILGALRRARDDYESEHAHCRFLLDAYSGTGGFAGRFGAPPVSWWGWAAEVYSREASFFRGGEARDGVLPRTYLDAFPREDPLKFEDRIATAHYANYVAPILDLLLSYLAKRPMQREGAAFEDGGAFATWMENADGRGTTWDELMLEVVRFRAALLGWCPVLVDAPRAPVAADGRPSEITAAQRLELGRATVLALYPSNVVDWDTDDAGQFRWLKLRLDRTERADALAQPVRVSEFRIYYRDRLDVYRVVGNDVVASESFDHGFGRVPVAIFRGRPAPDDPVRGISMVSDVAQANRRLFNERSEFIEYLRANAFAMLAIPAKDPTKVGELTAGNHNAIAYPHDASSAPAYIAPPSAPGALFLEAMAASVREIYRMARVEFTKPSGTSQSGVSRRYEFEQTNRRLADFGHQMARGESWLFQILGVAEGVGDDSAWTVSAPTDYSVEDLAAKLEAATKAVSIGLGSPTAEMHLREHLLAEMLPGLPSDVWQVIVDELEETRDEALEMRAQGLEAADAAVPPAPGATPEDDVEGDDAESEDDEERSA